MKVRIGVVGAGLAGAQHIAAILSSTRAVLAAIADPAPAGRERAASAGVPWFSSVEEMLRAKVADGAVLATPNRLHASGGLACVAAGIPVLVEKPLCDTAEAAAALAAAADAAGVPLLAGHHRRHGAIARRAKRVVDQGTLGRLTAVHAQAWLMKPDSYFGADWRVGTGGGPVAVNLIHDIDLLQYFCGPIAEVHAMLSNACRGHPVEDTAAITLRFANGALGTVGLSDSAAAPWSWELTSRENAVYPGTDQNCYWIAGTKGSLALPRLEIWRHDGRPSWWNPIGRTRIRCRRRDPMLAQIDHFADVVRGRSAPLVSGWDGLSALRVVEAIRRSSECGGRADVERDEPPTPVSRT